MFNQYINPVYAPFRYGQPADRAALQQVLDTLVRRYDGVKPTVDVEKQVELCSWDRRKNEEVQRLAISWEVPSMSEMLYQRLVRIFSESVLDDPKVASREKYRERRVSPARFLGFDGTTTGKIRGYPVIKDRDIPDKYDLSKTQQVLWVARQYSTVREAREGLRKRGRQYWFYSDGRFVIDLRVGECKEIEFIDAALRISVALNGSYDSFDRYKALAFAQKQLVRRNKQQVHEEEIVGLEGLIDDIKFRQFFATINPDAAKALGVTDESVLLVGVPGTGKSSIASSLLWDPALEDVVFIPLNVIELLEAAFQSDNKGTDTFFTGVRDIHRRYGLQPMLWCDDLEAAFHKDTWQESQQKAVAQSTLLNSLQGVTKDLGLRISGSTNYPDRIDPRFLEFGRISYMFHVPIPRDPAVLQQIVESHVKKRGQVLASDVELSEVAARSIGFTPRMLVNLVNEAGVQAAKRVFGRFSRTIGTISHTVPKPLKVTARDYQRADSFIRERTDVHIIARHDDEIAAFVEKHNRGSIGFFPGHS